MHAPSSSVRSAIRRVVFVCSALLSLFALWMSQQIDHEAEDSPGPSSTPNLLHSSAAKPPAPSLCNESLLGQQEGSSSPAGGGVGFHQVLTYVGPVELFRLDAALQALFRGFAGRKAGADGRRIVLYAVDGTLLNLLRWGQVLNDNDVDVGFHVEGIPLNDTMAHYYTLLRTLAAEGLIAPVTERDEKRLHASAGSVKRGKCKHRGQLMQCVLLGSGVMVDFFGPETMYSPERTQLTPQDAEPIVHCRAFATEFPCPFRYEQFLKKFTLDMSALPGGGRGDEVHATGHGHGGMKNKKGAAKTWYEFEGCALFPRRTDEHTRGHLVSIVQSWQVLDACGYPNLGFELRNPACTAIAARANITLPEAAAIESA